MRPNSENMSVRYSLQSVMRLTKPAIQSTTRGLVRRQVAAVLATAARAVPRDAGFAIVYHRIGAPGGDPARELVPALDRSVFEAQLRHLQSRYHVVRSSELRAAAAARRRGGRYPVAVTFDDDLASHVDVASPILQRLGIPATFFLTGASFDEPFSFWWEDLQRAAMAGRLSARPGTVLTHPGVDAILAGRPRAIHRLARLITTLPPDERELVRAALRTMGSRRPEEPRFDQTSVRRLTTAGFDIGFHTAHHEPLPTLSSPEMRDAMTGGRERIEDAAQKALTIISYPHGAADARVAEAARTAGFQLGFTMAPTIIRADDNPFLLGRIAPPFTGHGQLELGLSRRLAGIRISLP